MHKLARMARKARAIVADGDFANDGIAAIGAVLHGIFNPA
jgi:hypothetical protein